MASDASGTKQKSNSLEDLIWGRQYAATKDEDFLAGARRVGVGVAENSRDADNYTNLITSRKFIPGGRILAGAGSEHGNLLNCFVQDGAPFEDGTTKSVLLLARKLALVTKVGGGNGVNLDLLPPRSNYEGPLGTAWLTISSGHTDHDKVRDGTYMDLVRGEYTTQGYKNLRYAQDDSLPVTASRIVVEDSVDGIWSGAGEMVHALLAGEDVVIDLSNLRREGTPVAGSGGTSSGPASFAAEIFDNFARWASLGAADHAGPVATLRYVYAPTLRVIRQGGCLHPDTLVHTSKGTLRLAEIVDEHQIGWQDHYLKVATDQGWKDSPRGFNNGISDTLRVSLHNGQSLRGTAQHKLKVLRPDGSREWVEFERLKPGDYVIQSLDQHTGSPVTLQPVDVPHHNATPIEMPTVLTEDVALFLGYLWGDGFVSSGRVGFSVSHGSPMIEEGRRLFQDLFGLKVATEQKENDGSLILVTKSAHLVSWLTRNGFVKDGARNLTIPKAVRMSPRPAVGAFLRGLFEADGSLSHGMPALSTSSVRMAEDVAVMLAGIGIPTKRRSTNESRNRYSRHAIHSIRTVSHKGLERFKERVGWVAGSRLAKMGEHIADEGREQSWLLPHAPALLADVFTAMPAGVKGAPSAFTPARKTLSRYIRGERNLTATGYDRLRIDPHLQEHLPELAYDEYYVPVTAVEDAGRALTLDISVDENKTYLAGGFVTHNTRRGAGMATLSATHPDLEDFITCKDLDREEAEGDISTFNISVLASDGFMRRAIDSDENREAATLREIARHAWQTGEPGVIFIDAINAHNPLTEVDGPIMATNPCVTADTWVMTSEGARQVGELVGRDFTAVVDGKHHALDSKGFWSTGVKQVLRITTKQGFELRVTGNHQLKRVDRQGRHSQETSWVPAETLLPGDKLMLQNHRSAAAWDGAGSYGDGWLLGTLVGDGTFQTDKSTPMACLDFWGEEQQELAAVASSHIGQLETPTDRRWNGQGTGVRTRISSSATARLASQFGIAAGSKLISKEVERASYDFYRGFLRGLFDADGSVQGNQSKGVSVRLAQSDLTTLQGAQRMLARIGIVSTVYENRRAAGNQMLPDGRGGSRGYAVKAQHELVISRDNLSEFASRIGFENKAKNARLQNLLSQYNRTANRERFSDEIVNISIDGEEEVFDVTVRDVHAFDANGFTAHNCGEIPLYPGEPCDLGAINLAAHIVDNRLDNAMLTRTARQAVRFLDDVLTAEVAPLPEIHDAIQDKRRIGLGVMGLADMLIRLGVRYDSDDGRAAVRRVMDIMREAALAESADLAVERGIPEGVRRAGLERRNIAVFTVAPTGTTSMLAGVSGGVEPVFAATYTRRIGTDYVKVVHPLLEDILAELEPQGKYSSNGQWDHEAMLEVLDEHHGSLQPMLKDLPSDPRLNAFVIAHDVAPRDHVLMQATVQRSFDWKSDSDWRNVNNSGRTFAGNSISKTCNLPNQAVVSDVLEAYELAWEEGCKGITVYRDGSRELQVLTSGKKQEEPVQAESTVQAQEPEPASVSAPNLKKYERQPRMMGVTDKVNLVNSNGVRRGFFITVNSDASGHAREVFIVSGKAGDEANGDSEALGRVVSIALQHGVPPEALISTLRGISGGMFGTYHSRIVTSKADLISVALETAVAPENGDPGHLKPSVTRAPDLPAGAEGCPHCGSEMRMAEGCMTCTNQVCGWSAC